jgi:hypothetical protein
VSTSERMRRITTCVFVILGSAVAGCDAASAGACVRFSDCASGLTCAAGECVVPPSPTDATAASADATSATTTPTPGDESTPGPTEAGNTTDETDNTGSDDASNPSAE